MEIRELERAFRAAVGDGSSQPALAAPGIMGRVDAHLPAEFQAAARTLASRSGDNAPANGILRAMAAQWA
jgi:hypothetical protein